MILSALALFAFSPSSRSTAQTQYSRPVASQATSVGVPLSTIVIFGDPYNGGDELYDVRITVQQVVRGEKAWQVIKAAGDSNRPPARHMDYLLARVKFEFAARARPEHYRYALAPSQFSAISSTGSPYAPAILAAPVTPDFHGTLRSGDTAEGWLAFLIPQGDHTPLMIFRPDVGSVIHQGDAHIFKLYNDQRRR